MQQGHRFVCSVATGVEEATPLRSAATGRGWGLLVSVRPARGGIPLPPGSAIGRGEAPGFFPSFLG